MAKKELGNRLFEGNVDYSADSSVKLLKAAENSAATDQYLVLDSNGVLKKVAQPSAAAGAVKIGTSGPELHVSGVSAGAVGSSSAVPVITINAQGLITAASTAAISTSLKVGADTGSDITLDLGDADILDIVGNTNGGIESDISGDGNDPQIFSVKLKMDINDLAAGSPGSLAATDELAFADASSSNLTKKISLSDLLDGIAGAGIARNGAALELKPSEFTEVTPSVGSDSVTLLDDTGAGTYASDVANQSAGASFNWLEIDSGSPGSGFAVDNYVMDQFSEPTEGSTQFSTLSGDARKIVAVYQTSSKTWIAIEGAWMNGGPPSTGRYLVTFASSTGGNTPSASQVAGSVREVTSSDVGSPSSGGVNWTQAIFRIPFSSDTTLTAADHALKHSISGTQHGGIAKLNVGTVTIMNNRAAASNWSLSTTAFGASDCIIHIDNGSTQIFPDDGDSSTGQDSVSLSSSNHDFFAGTYTPTLVARKATLAAISSGMAGDGLGSSSGVLSVGVDGSSLEISSDALRVKAAGVTNTMLANSTITMQADSGSNQAMSLGETFDIAGGTGISSVASSDSITLGLDNTAVSAGSYGDAGNDDKVPSFTVDAQGRLTAAGHTIIDIAHTQVNDFDAGVRANRLDQMAVPTGAVAMNSQKLTGVTDPTAAQDAATKSYVDSVAQGLEARPAVRVATTANITIASALNVGDSIDGITLADGDRVLVKNQSSASENGIYVAGASPARAADMTTGDQAKGHFFFVEEGTVNADNGFVCTSDATADTVGTHDLAFVQFSGAGQITAGAAMTKTGNTLDVAVDDSSIEVNADALRVKAGGVTNAMLNGSIANDKLANSTISGKALGTNLAALAVDDSSIEYSAGTDFNGSAASTIQVKALGITNAMLTGSIAAGKLAGSIPDSKLSTITTADKVSGSAVQLASGSALEDSSGLQLKAATAGDGIDMTSQVLKVDVKANGGLVIESSKLAIDLAANSFTNQLADSDLATIVTADKVSGSAVQLTSGGSAIENSSGLRLKAATAGEGLDMDSAQVLSIAHDSLSLDPKSDGNTFEVKGHSAASQYQVALRGADNAPLSWVYSGLDVEFKLDYTSGTPAVAASYSSAPAWLKYNDANVAASRVAIQLTHTDLFGAGMPDGYVVQLFLVDDSTSQQLVGTDTKRITVSGLSSPNDGLNGGWVTFDLEDVSSGDSNVTFKMSVVAAPKAVAGA